VKALPKGAYIQHCQYGLGVVTHSDSEDTDIDFDLHGMKKFLRAIVVLEHAEGTPPRRRKTRKKAPASALKSVGLK
jgi:hypothetical protein